jgi:hypothetical protein
MKADQQVNEANTTLRNLIEKSDGQQGVRKAMV